MENATLIFNTMKTKVEMKPRDWAEYTFLVIFAIFVYYVAVIPHH